MNPSDWFEGIDRLRQRQGTAMERLGLGPHVTPSHVVLILPGLRLRCYGAGRPHCPPLLIVPAPIKRWYIWDLSPERSVVRKALAQGFGVYVIEWSAPPRAGGTLGLADYAGPMIDACADVIARLSACRQVFLCGHSLGGILATLYSAWRQERVAALALFEAPVNFNTVARVLRRGAGAALLASVPPDRARRIPGSVLSAIFANAAPGAFYAAPGIDLLASAVSPRHLATHLRVQRWALDELPMARLLFDEVVALLFAQNSFIRGELVLGGTRLAAHQVTAPLLTLYRPISSLAPPDTVLGFHNAAGSVHKVLLPYLGDVGVALQHVAPLVGDSAHLYVWPRVLDWLAQLSPVPRLLH
ncbi:alpha/beta fold hydrolase [Massilia scottii]|uniref:alpha/beta fold hydrolase n=1 Tax=Massilia scottii TaxID=3057166 RepID=UPI002796D8DC|nr:alpha/beta fold hydrolase [Massilia sp. CCM 9029]MDQ1833241.1 alpha/beta hydrolase [Massilia sp. CCM 9029]